jgi:hypothetical protein
MPVFLQKETLEIRAATLQLVEPATSWQKLENKALSS